MRLDVFLKLSRLVPRRNLAQEMIKAGSVSVNGASGKSGRDIKSGDVIEVLRPNQRLRVRVLTVPETKQVSKRDSANLFETLSDEKLDSGPPF